MATKKKEKTVQELLRDKHLEQIENFSIDDGEEEHSLDQILEAASQQGLLELYNPFEERAKKIAEEEAQAPKRPSEAQTARQTFDQLGNLGNMVKKTETETLPRITNEAIKNYNLSKTGRDYLSNYTDSTSYTDVKNDIEELKNRKGGAARRNRDTAMYDRAIAMLEEYAANNYSLNDNKTSYADKEAIYENNKQIEEGLGEKSNSATDPMYRDYALMTWLGSYDHKGIKDSATNQAAIKSFNEATGEKGYDLSNELGELKDDEIASKADELRTYFQDKYGYKYNTDYLNAAQNFYSDLQNRYNKAKTDNKTYERTGEAAAYTADIVKKDDYADKSAVGDYGTPTTKEDIDEYLKNNQAVDYNNIQGFDSKNVDSLPDKLGSFLSAEDIKDQNTSSEFSPERKIAINLQKTDNAWTHPFNTSQSGYDDLMTEGYNNGWDVISDEEKGAYYYIYNTEGKEAAYEYLNSLKNTLQKRKNYDNVKEATQNSADSGTVDNLDFILRSAASVPDNAFGGASGTLDNVAHYISGEDIEPYSPAHAAALSAAATREATGEALDEQFWHTDSPWGVNPSDIYGGVMSSADMLTSYFTGEAPYGALMGLSAAESTARDLYEQGEDNATIAKVSTASGIAEALFEKLSIEQIWNIANLDGAKTAKEIVKKYAYNMARAAGVEASEEVATEAANMVVDNIVRGSRSDTADASIEDIGSRLYKAGVGGAIGGLLGGGGATTLSAVAKSAEITQNKIERNKYIASVGADVTNAGNTQALLDTADQMKDNAEVQAQAEKVRQAQTNNAEKGTESTAKALSRETGKLYAAIQDSNAQGIQNAEADEIKAAIKQAYAAETGEDVKSDTVTQAAEAIYKSEYTGEKLTRAERNLASTSQAQSAVESVRNNPDLIEQGTQKAQERAFNKYISTAQLTQKQETKTDEDVDIAEFNVHEDDNKVYTADGRKQVDIASVASIGKNDITFALKDGQTESAKALDMPTKQAVLAQSVLDVQKSMGVDLTPEIANALYKGYEQSDIKSVSAYMQDAQKVLFNGYTNNTKIDNTINLPQGLRNRLYSMGRQLAASHTQAQQQAVVGRVKGNKPRKGSVTFVDGIKRGQLDSRRRAGVDTVENLAKSLGFDVVFYRSTKNGKGRYSSEYVRKNKFTAEGQQAPSGFWRGGKMYLDINAGMNGEGLILFTASHELVHMIREGSPEDFKALADFLVKNYAEQGVDINDLVLKEMSKSTNLTRDEAFEEVIAESCEPFLRDTHLNGKAQELYKQNPTLWSRIREALKRIINSIKEAYAAARPQSEEARIINRADIETLEKAYDLWTKGIIKSAENLRNMESNRTDTKYQGRAESTDAEYLDAVERGDMETAQSMVDEAAKAAGYDRHLYHGAKAGGGFTVFKGWQYFTENKAYAERYTQRDTGKGLYDVYVKSDRLFDTRKSDDRAIFGEYKNEYGMGELQENGLPDWTDGYDLSEIIEENELDYDGIVLDEGGDLVDGKPVSRGLSYVIRDSSQVKSADPVTYDDNGDVIPLSERFNESNKDIRYQSRDDDLFSIELSDDDTITNVAAREFVTHHEDMGEVLKNIADIDIEPKRVDSIINHVAREYLGSLDAEARHTLSIEIQLALERVNNTDAQTVSDTIIDAVRWAIEKGTVSDERAEANYKDLLDAFKGKKFYLTDEQINQLKEHDMTLDGFRKAMFGKMTIVKRENAKRSINGGYADAQQLSLEGLHDVLADADAVLGLRSWQWDQENYDAPYIIKEAFDGLNRLRNQPVSQVYSDQAIDDMAVAMSAKITGGIVEEKYKSKYKGKDSQQIRQALASQQKQTNDYIDSLVEKLMEKYETELAEQKKQSEQKLSELKQKERERAEKREKKLTEHYKEQRAKSVEKRNLTKQKNIVARKFRSLDQKLNRADKNKTVKEGLRPTAAKLLEVGNMLFPETRSLEQIAREGVADATPAEQKLLDRYVEYLDIREKTTTEEGRKHASAVLANIRKLLSNEGVMVEVTENGKTVKKKMSVTARERMRYDNAMRDYNGLKLKTALSELEDAYRTVKNSSLGYIADSYDPNIVESIQDLRDDVGNTLAKDMTADQLKTLNDIVTDTLTSIKNANKSFTQERSITDTANAVIRDIKNTRVLKDSRFTIPNKAGEFLAWNNFKPIYAMRYIGSDTFTDLFWKLQKGESDWYVDIAEAKEFKDNLDEKYGVGKLNTKNKTDFNYNKKAKFTALDGSEFTLSLDQMMDIYAASRREQALQHLTNGGFTFAKDVKSDKFGKIKTGAKVYQLTTETIDKIADTLTVNEKKYVEEMQEYLSTVMADKGNEVSMQLHGLKLFNEETYWSISSTDIYAPQSDVEQEQKKDLVKKIRNAGFTKKTVKNASNPIVLQGFETKWSSHVNDMSLYHSMTLPLEDFTRVANYKERGQGATATTGVRGVLIQAYGNAASNYINQLIDDINGGIQQKMRVGLADNLVSLAKKGAVLNNLSVVIQQPSAVFRAMAYVDMRYFMLATGNKFWSYEDKQFTWNKHNQMYEELIKYAPVAGIKRMGSFDTGAGRGVIDYLSSSGNESLAKRAYNKGEDIASFLPEFADELAWLKLWQAIQHETKAKYGYKIGTEENKVKSGERFNEVVHLTQVYDSTLSRSQAMRGKDFGSKMLTSFMAEPTTYMNMAVDAVVQSKRTHNFKQLTKTMSALSLALIANALLVAIPRAMRDDDDDETFDEKYKQAFWDDIVSGVNPLNYFPVLKDVSSIVFENRDPSRMDLSVISDTANTLKKAYKNISNGEFTANDVIDIIGSVAAWGGISVKNLVRDIRSVINTAKTVKNPRYNKEVDKMGLSLPFAYQKAYDKAYDQGYSETECKSKGESAARKEIAKALKDKYLKALKESDSETMSEIMRYMAQSGYYNKKGNTVDDTLKEWRKGSDEADKRAKVAEERKSK